MRGSAAGQAFHAVAAVEHRNHPAAGHWGRDDRTTKLAMDTAISLKPYQDTAGGVLRAAAAVAFAALFFAEVRADLSLGL